MTGFVQEYDVDVVLGGQMHDVAGQMHASRDYQTLDLVRRNLDRPLGRWRFDDQAIAFPAKTGSERVDNQLHAFDSASIQGNRAPVHSDNQ
jgi:hypothetical protein